MSSTEEHLTIRGIAKELRKSYTLVYNNIADLEKNGIIKKKDVPPAKIITLNESAPDYIFVGIELKRKNLFIKKYIWARVMLDDILSSTNNFFILLVFGSYAKGKETRKSDLDLLCIVDDKNRIKESENALHMAYTKVKKGVVVVSVEDFKEMIKDKASFNVGNEARKHHVILHGAEQYYSILNK